MRRKKKDAARQSFEYRRNDRRKHGLGRCVILTLFYSIDSDHFLVLLSGADAVAALQKRDLPVSHLEMHFVLPEPGLRMCRIDMYGDDEGDGSNDDAAAEEDEEEYEPATWRGKYYFDKLGLVSARTPRRAISLSGPTAQLVEEGCLCEVVTALLMRLSR